MQRRPISLAAITVGTITIGLLVAVHPAAAATGYDSNIERLIRTLSGKLIFLAAAVGLLVEGALVYAIIRYRNSGNAEPTETNSRFHITYVVAVSLILLFVGFASVQTLIGMNQATTPAQTGVPAEDTVQVNIVGQRWLWSAEYPNENITTFETFAVPVNRTVRLNLTSQQVIHSFHAPALGLKQDAVPGQQTELVFTPTDTGNYTVYCAQYCGTGHYDMLANLLVLNESAYENWVDEHHCEPQEAGCALPESNETR